jgi:hypothetical protein
MLFYRSLSGSLLVLFIILSIGAIAQASIVSAGGYSIGSGGSLSYSLGQVVYSTSSTSTGSVTEGVQQPYEILVMSINEKTNKVFVEIFPNPTSDMLILRVVDENYSTLKYQLYDIEGKIINSNQASAKETYIDMKNYNPAIYIIQVYDNNLPIQTFKILKN